MLDDNNYPRMEPLSLNLKDFLHYIFLKWIWSFNLTNLIWNLTSWSHLLGFYQDRFRLVPVQPQILLAPILVGSHV
jgi:hypothetical protein